MFFKFFKQQREIALQNLIKDASDILDNSIRFENDSLIARNTDDVLPYLNYLKRKVKKKFPQFQKDYISLQKRFDFASELRLYGADLNTIIDSIKSTKGALDFEIDWVKASSQKLPFIIEKGVGEVKTLDKKSQKYLKNIWEHLFFEKSLFITGWRSFLQDGDGNIGFLVFDNLIPVSFELKKFALSRDVEAKTFEEQKLMDSINLLKDSCPDIDPFEGWSKIRISKENTGQDDSYFNYIQEANPDMFSKLPAGIDPKKLAHLLDSKRHAKDPRFRKSSVFYWAPLLLAAYILYKFF